MRESMITLENGHFLVQLRQSQSSALKRAEDKYNKTIICEEESEYPGYCKRDCRDINIDDIVTKNKSLYPG